MLDGYIKTAVVERELSALAVSRDRYPFPNAPGGFRELALVRALLDRRPYPVFVMDASAIVHLTNREADTRITDYGLTAVEGSKLRFADSATASRFLRLVRTMTANAGAQRACEVFSYELSDGHCATLSLSRVEAGLGGDGIPSPPLFLVSVRRNLGAIDICADRLMATFGLTKAEANICAALAQNISLQDYSAREGIKITTARWHLQNVYERTGVNSQTELVAMIVSVML